MVKPHYLGRTGPCKPKARFAVLTVETQPAVCELTGRSVLSWTSASMRTYVYTAGDYSEELDCTVHRDSKRSPWLVLCGWLERNRVLEVWTLQADNALRATGFIDELDDGVLTIKTDGWNGYAVTTNPPYIITVRPTIGKGIIKVICLSNIGVNSDSDLCGCGSSISKASSYVVSWFAGIQSQNLGPIKCTIAAQSWAAYRHRFMRKPLLCHTDNIAHKLEESATFSGRAECFRMGNVEGPLYHYDVKSCYPNLLKGRQVPCRLKHVREGDTIALSQAIASCYACVADVSLTTEVPIFPVTRNGLTIWPVGTFRTLLCGPELELAMQLTPTPIAHRFAAYETDDIFSEWCEWALSFREKSKLEGDKVGENVAKLLTNCLWGRFAKRDRSWQNVDDDCSYKKWDDWYERTPGSDTLDHYRTFGGLTQVMQEGGFNRESVPIITAFINSLGRMALWEIMSFVGREHVVYCATDSLIVTECGHARICACTTESFPFRCSMKLERTYESVNFRGIHHYDSALRTIDAGLPKCSVIGENGVGIWTALEPLYAAMKRKEKPSASLIQRHLDTNTKYLHGRVLPDGKVEPWRLDVAE